MTLPSSRGAGDHRRPAALLAGTLAVVLALSGCAVGGDRSDAFSPTPRADLARKAEVGAKNLAQKPHRGKRGDRGNQAKGGAHPGAGPGADSGSGVDPEVGSAGSGGGPAPGDGTTAPRVVLTADDGSGDHGIGAKYADLTRVSLVDLGGDVRITVSMAATIPGHLADGEVQGVGVDFFRSSSQESDHQVFLDGGSEGWSAYLQTPRGFTRFPGSFSVAGKHLTVTLPWTAVGGERAAQVSAFVDWSNAVLMSTSDYTEKRSLQLR